MPDEVTRDHARRMHYAAHRLRGAKTPAEVRRWRGYYFGLRDRIVLGNRKLIYRAVRRQMAMQHRADDLIGDCHIVLIQAVAAFNPWMGIRFSTYAYTCLVRALSRQSQKHAADRLSRALSFDALPDREPRRKGRRERGGREGASHDLVPAAVGARRRRVEVPEHKHRPVPQLVCAAPEEERRGVPPLRVESVVPVRTDHGEGGVGGDGGEARGGGGASAASVRVLTRREGGGGEPELPGVSARAGRGGGGEGRQYPSPEAPPV